MKNSVYFIVGILIFGSVSAAFPSSLMFKKAGVPVFAVQGNTVVWLTKPPITENSSVAASSQGLEIKRGGELRLWTNQDNINIPGTVVPVPSPVLSQSLAFKNGTAPKTTVYPSPTSGNPALGCGNGGDSPVNLTSQDMYLENHVSHSDLVNHITNEYCCYGDGRIEFNPGASDRKLLYHKDHLGSTRAVEAANGTVLERVAYDAYGAITFDNLSGNEKPDKEKFTGKEYEKDGLVAGVTDGLQLDYFGARYYDPDVGIFIRTDPAGQMWAAYSYSPNPINTIDPTGAVVEPTDARSGLDFVIALADAVINDLPIKENMFALMDATETYYFSSSKNFSIQLANIFGISANNFSNINGRYFGNPGEKSGGLILARAGTGSSVIQHEFYHAYSHGFGGTRYNSSFMPINMPIWEEVNAYTNEYLMKATLFGSQKSAAQNWLNLNSISQMMLLYQVPSYSNMSPFPVRSTIQK